MPSSENDSLCFARGVDGEGNPNCRFASDHDGPHSDMPTAENDAPSGCGCEGCIALEKSQKREALIAGMVEKGYTRERAEELFGTIAGALRTHASPPTKP